ncbi:MAG: hypothetical protein V3T05_06470 [Myxococcota bacterium]
MQSSMSKWRAGLAGLTALIVSSTAGATMVLPIELEQMTVESEVIMHARVLGQEVRWSKDHARILTLTTIEVLAPIKNAVKGDRITIYQVAGTLDGVTFRIPGALQFEPGREMVFFAMQFRDMLVSYGMGLGKYAVRTIGGKRWAMPEHGDVVFVKRDPRGHLVNAPRPDTTGQELSAFLDRLRAILAVTGGGQ